MLAPPTRNISTKLNNDQIKHRSTKLRPWLQSNHRQTPARAPLLCARDRPLQYHRHHPPPGSARDLVWLCAQAIVLQTLLIILKALYKVVFTPPDWWCIPSTDWSRNNKGKKRFLTPYCIIFHCATHIYVHLLPFFLHSFISVNFTPSFHLSQTDGVSIAPFEV